MLSLDFNFVLEMINLVILYLLLRKFLIGPIMNIMEKRRAMIADGIQNANDQQAKAMELKSQYEDALSGAKDESRRMIEQAKADAKKEYDRILKDADNEAGKIMKTARETIDLEREQTLRQMKTEVAGLAMDAAKKIMMDSCSEKGSQAVYDQFLKEAGDPHEDSEDK
ncbi:F0F1 ATP synthase subunit B [Clostridium sp. BSD2780061688st1 H5]|uniref:F0F1 ATP synthase subunit B n=1 Tax=Eubacteriales TaxID=186802 RepID=UPI00110750AE|nr:F0F1 ATP synthase subunit B [Clostridium sp. BSD2780061688st1 H5]HIX97978.1 F0F1 ATP synthase subunit B [Candidatus Dorea intestinigallinarum]